MAGTLVHTPDGLKPIESLKVGDQVLSQPELTGEIAYRRINETFQFVDKPVLEIVYQDDTGRTGTLTATPNHPFWVKGEGWTAAELLEPGHALELHDRSEARVLEIADHGRTATVHNFEVDGFHTYYVGEAGVWVHNTNCGEGASRIDKARAARERRQFWKEQASENSSSYSSKDLARMRSGKPPVGDDGYPLELHHVDRTHEGALEILTRTAHRFGANFRKNHPKT